MESETFKSHHTNIWDFRSKENPLNNFLITCEHASNNFHEYEKNLTEEDLKYVNTHWGLDIGAIDMAYELSKELQCVLVAPNFSRLVLDPNRVPISESLIRRYVYNHELSINKPDVVDRKSRLERFYYPYIETLNSKIQEHKPDFFISIHSFTPYYEDEKLRDFQVGLLYNRKGPFFDFIESAFSKTDVAYELNKPYSNTIMVGVSNMLGCYKLPKQTECVTIEIRNDYCSDPTFRKKLISIIAPAVIEFLKVGDKQY